MPFDISDGYTVITQTKPTYEDTDVIPSEKWSNLPIVRYTYRPALGAAIWQWSHKLSVAKDGAERFEETCKFLCDHLLSWDVTNGGIGKPSIVPAHVGKLPLPIFKQILAEVKHWSQSGEQEKDKGN